MKKHRKHKASWHFLDLWNFLEFLKKKSEEKRQKNLWKLYLKIAMYLDDFAEVNKLFRKFYFAFGDLMFYRFFEVVAK